MANFTTENNNYCFPIGPAFLDMTIRKVLIRRWIFRYFSFTFYIQFILVAGKEALEIKRTFDRFTLAHSSLILNLIAEGHLWAGNYKVSTEFDCQRISVIVHRSASDKLAVVHSSCLFGAESYSEECQLGKVSNERFVNSCLANSPSVYITQLYVPYKKKIGP